MWPGERQGAGAMATRLAGPFKTVTGTPLLLCLQVSSVPLFVPTCLAAGTKSLLKIKLSLTSQSQRWL